MKFVLALILLSLSACVQKPVLPLNKSQDHAGAVPYCMGAFLENSDKDGKLHGVVVSLVIQSTSSLRVNLESKRWRLSIDGKQVLKKDSEFWVLRGEKQIWQRYPESQYSYEPVADSDSQWRVRKKKWKGLFGSLFMEAPFFVSIPQYPNEKITENRVEVVLDPEILDEVYVFAQETIRLPADLNKPVKIRLEVPALQINDVSVPAENYVFNYDPKAAVRKTSGADRCSSLEESFQWRRSKEKSVWRLFREDGAE